MSVIIGITHSYEDNFIKLNLDYLKSISMFNAVSLIIPYSENIDEILNLTDGIILSGGGDLSENLLTEKISSKAENVNPERDIFEAELCRKAYEKNIPLLGICRGIQVINTALGGKIHQHIKNHISKYSDLENPIKHKIYIEKDSMLYKITKTETVSVNSYHHQCVSEISPKLKLCAISEDSIIEAVEGKDRKFFLGVQWHPEKMKNSFSKNIFKAFIDSCTS